MCRGTWSRAAGPSCFPCRLWCELGTSGLAWGEEMLVLLRWVPQSAQGEPRFVSRGRAPPGLTQPCALCPQWFAAPGLMLSTEGWLRRHTRSPTGCPCASPAMKASCCVVMLRAGVRPTAPGSRRCPPASQVGLAFGCSTARCCLLLQLPWCLLLSRAVLPFVNPSCTPWGCNFALMFGFVTL